MDPNATTRVKHAVQVLTTMLMDISRTAESRREAVANFQKEVWNLTDSSADFPELRILRDLALELDYYQPDATVLKDNGRSGDQELEAKIGVVIKKLTEPKKRGSHGP